MTRIAVLLLVGVVLAGCSESPDEVRSDYCEVVSAQQEELSEIMAEESPATLLRALPVFRELAEGAPGDIEDDWTVVVEALSGLERALEEADVDPSTYDATKPPAGVSRDQRRAIARAAEGLARPEVAAALEGVQQHAKDVCKKPLYL